MDRVTKVQRSHIMSRIRSKNTKPELIIFKLLKDKGLKFKKHYKLLGSPDVVFPKEKIAIFIDGDFWHGGKDFKKRKTALPEYWVNKITRNMRRDRRYRSKLKSEGWKVMRLWEYRTLKNPEKYIEKIVNVLDQIANNVG